ncbi:MAG TPA: hypothetical protein VKE26_21665 [Xanthobacteraceae bacterium]|nr:hypothetical protein [Xanthobacteraceae bacterium]
MRLLLILVMAVGLASSARAADPRNPDWPCVQVKVPELSVAAMWAGPPIDDVGRTWEDDPKVKDLVARLAARRLPLEEAQRSAADFLAGSGDAKQAQGKLLFAGLFATLDRLRSEVITGIERYTRRQREFAEQVRGKTLKLREMQDAPNSDQKQVEELAEQVEWDTRIFEERRRTINYVCEVPVLIEQRLFALSRTIQEAME